MTVYEKADRLGGLLRYGIPNFKLEKHILDRRIAQMSAEGVEFVQTHTLAITSVSKTYNASSRQLFSLEVQNNHAT